MNELASLLSAIAGLVTAFGGLGWVGYAFWRTSRGERNSAARDAAVDLLLDAEDDPEFAEELAERMRRRRREGP